MNGHQNTPRFLVVDSISPAIERTKAMLFGPIIPGMWLRFGVLIFFEELSRGGGANVNMGGWRGVPSDFGSSLDEAVEIAANFLAEYAAFVLGGIVLSTLILAGLRYLTCRVEVIFIRGCAAGATSLTLDWRDTRAAGNSLFRFHLVLIALGLGVILLCTLFAYGAYHARHELATALPWLVALGVLVLAASIFFGLADSLTRQFVSPLMVRHDIGWREAWGRVGPVLLANAWPLLGYYLLKILFWISIWFAAIFVGCATLCIGFLPIIQQTLLAPLHVFERNWSMVMLHYLGPGFEVFYEPEQAPEDFSGAPWDPIREDAP